MTVTIGRRGLLAALGGAAAAWPLAARAQQPALPVIGFVNAASPQDYARPLSAFLRGPSLNRPGGNVTGVTNLGAEVAPKLLELLHELVPTATVMALLVNPADPTLAETQSREVLSAAHTLGLELHVLNASSERDFDAVFANLIQLRAGGLVISAGSFFFSRSEQLAALALRNAVPTVFEFRDFAAAGGLMSYSGDIEDSYRLAGIYTGRILKGDKPANLPVQQVTKVKLYINLTTAKALGITFPVSLLGRADEVFE